MEKNKGLKIIKKNTLPLTLIILIMIMNTIYGFINNPLRGVHNLVTELDKSTPFLSGFVIPYIAWYPFMAFIFIYLCIYYREIYYRVILSLGLGMIISYIIYFFFQTTVPRPEIAGNSLLNIMVKLIYYSDKPYNCFPSIHVLSCYIIIKGTKKSNAGELFKLMTYLTAVTIILSTLFIKQHVIMDVVSAILLAEGVYRIIDYMILSGAFSWVEKVSWIKAIKRRLEV